MIYNLHHKNIPEDVIRIDRGTKWGNPFVIGKDGNRDEVCDKHFAYLKEQIKTGKVTLKELASLYNKDLACWCSPNRCHGDTLEKLSIWAYNKLNPIKEEPVSEDSELFFQSDSNNLIETQEKKLSNKIVKREVRFAWFLPKNDYREDSHYVREDVTYEDGRQEPNCYVRTDFKRPIYVTKQAFRNHKDKKEFELKENLIGQMTTQSDIDRVVANMLGKPHIANNKDEIKNSPYVYGYDVTSTSLIKYTTLKQNDFVQSAYSVAAFDIETNPDTQEILLSTVAYRDKVHTSILAKFLKNIPNVQEKIKKAIIQYIPEYADLNYSISICDSEVELLKDNFRVINKWKPAFLAIWNMDFDIPKILERLKHYNVSPTDVLCDQEVPKKYRTCRYKQGLKRKETASGVIKPINPSLQWHTLIVTAPYYVIDSMCVYRQLRISGQEKTSYSLDNILKEEGIGGKLKFEPANGYSGIRWHLFLQENYPIEYIVYNIYDCLGMLELDKKNNDLSNTLPSYANITDFQKYNSQVRKISDSVFLFGLEKNRIIGTAPKVSMKEEESAEVIDVEDDDEDDEDEQYNEDGEILENPNKYKTLDLKGWIQLLPQNLLLNQGLKVIEEYPEVITNLRGLTCDMDMISSYPSCTTIANVSKETCFNELIRVDGMSEEDFREQNLSICLGNVNLLEYFNVVFDLPEIADLDIDAYM